MAQQPTQQSNGPPLIKPGQIDQLPHLDQATRVKYKQGLAQLWHAYENSLPGSPQRLDAENKIRQASMQLMQQISNRGNNRPASGGAGGGVNQAQRPQGQGAPVPNAGQQPTQQGVANAAAGGQQPIVQQGQTLPGMSAQSSAELTSVKINIPPNVAMQGEQAINNYQRQWRTRGTQFLQRRDQARAKGSQLQKAREANPAQAQQINVEIEKMRAEMQMAHSEWEKLKMANTRVGQQASAGGNVPQPGAGGAGGQPQQPPQQPQAVQQAPGQTQQDGGKMDVDQQGRTAMSPTQPQGAFGQQQQPQPSQQAQGHPAAPSVQTNLPPRQNSSTPQTATQSQSAQAFPQNAMNQQQQQQQQRAAMNAQQMAQQQAMANAGMAQNASQHQPQQQMPQSGHQQQPQRPQALTQQAAISQASLNRQDSSQQVQGSAQQQQPQQQPPHPQQQPQQPMSNMQNGLSLHNPPQSAAGQTLTSAYAQMPQQISSSTKFPIPKTLQLDPRMQNPVAGPPSRPTFANAGMMTQPGIQRAGQFTLEGEGDRVLSKRKLDELVRQVTGSADAGDSSTTTDSAAGGGGGLAPDVEEAVLTLADDFVDNVITSACRLAKLRASQTLDIKDIQIVLERNYGIRIPGYGLDEVRTVRKFQPAEGWRSKMQAVQAGKVMGGNAGKEA